MFWPHFTLKERLDLEWLEYIKLWWALFFLHLFARVGVWRARTRRTTVGLVPLNESVKEDRVIFVPSAYDKGRKIRVHVFEPPTAGDKPLPVHINFHGSGFVVPLHGADSEICRYLSRKLNAVILDTDYAKGPLHPAPHATQDALSIIAYAQAQPKWLDRDRITVGGFSAGGNLALIASSIVHPQIRAAVVWYPPCDLRGDGSGLREMQPDTAGEDIAGIGPGTAISEHVAFNVFKKSYLQKGGPADDDPIVNPMMRDPKTFPPITLIVGTGDQMYPDCRAFYDKLKDAGAEIDIFQVSKAKHAWERFVEDDSVYENHREEAFRRTVERLRSAYES